MRTFLAMTALSLVARAPLRAETDWVLLLDRSESMTQNDPQNYRFDAQKIMVDLLAQGVGEVHRLTIIRFAGTAQVVLSREIIRTENIETIRKTIATDPPQGDTDIGAALELARKTVKPEGRASDIKVILLSDGVQAGKIPNLQPRLEGERKTYQELGLAINTIILNDFSMSAEDRKQRREQRYSYDDRTLRGGEDLMRDLARKTRGRVAQVAPGQSIEDILLNLISPYMSFYRESISGRIRTFPTDRQLFILLNRATSDVRFRIGNQELAVDLGKEQALGEDYGLKVSPYSKRTVVMVRPAENVRWPEWIDVLPGPSQNRVEGDVFFISNLRLIAVQGFGISESEIQEGLKTRIRENEVYPLLFRILVPDDVTADRKRLIQDCLKDCAVQIVAQEPEGKVLEQKALPALQVFTGTGNKPYFVPTFIGLGDTKIKEPFGLTIRASIERAKEAGQRSMARAPDRAFVVYPSTFDWLVRRNWKGEPESSSRPVTRRVVELELGQEFRLEVLHTGAEVLGSVEIFADYSRAGESAARKLILRDMGGIPRTFRSDWIFPSALGEYLAKVTLKSDVVQEVDYRIVVLRDDFRPANAQYSADGTDSAKAGDAGSYVMGEKIKVTRLRVIDRLTAEATKSYWEAEGTSGATAHLLRKDGSGGRWVPLREIPLTAQAPTLGTPQIQVSYGGEIVGLDAGDYVVTWPEKHPLGPDVAADPRSDVFRVLGPAFSAKLFGEDGTPLLVEGGKAIHQAGKKLVAKITPTETFPAGSGEEITGTLTWARKDVGGPQVVKALKGQDGSYSMAFPTTDFHTGAARLRVLLAWKTGSLERSVDQFFEISSMPKVLGLAMDPITEDIFVGERQVKVRFRIRAIGGQNPQAQRDLLSLWLSQAVNLTIGESEQIYRVNLEADGEHLIGSLDHPDLPVGTYKLVVNSPVAKLGQDIAACFFNVKPCPFLARVLKSSSGADQKVLLEPGVTNARCEGDGVLWAVVEGAKTESEQTKAPKLASARLILNSKPMETEWSQQEGGALRSKPYALENLERDTAIVVVASDDSGRTFEWPLGSLTVEPVPLGLDVVWSKAPPQELGRGNFCRIQGMIRIRGGTRAEREKARDALRASAATVPFLAASPATVLTGFQVLPASTVAQEPRGTGAPAGPAQAKGEAAFGEFVSFEVTLKVGVLDQEVQDSFTVEVRDDSGKAIEARRVSLGVATTRLLVGRPDADPQGGILPQEFLPITARERVRVAIDDKGEAADTKFQIQVFPPQGDTETRAGVPLKSEAKTFDFSPKKEGVYRIVAEALASADCGWSTEEQLNVVAPLKLEWSQKGDGAMKLDAGQYLPLFVRIGGPSTLDWDTFQRLFALKHEVLGEGGQEIVVEFSPWEIDKTVAGSGLAVKAFSRKPITGSAARVRVSLEQVPAAAGATPLDVLELNLVQGGGSLVVVENFEKGERGYVLRDLVQGFRIPKSSRIRFGFRAGSTLTDVSSLKNRITAKITSPGGAPEKVLDVESTSASLGLVVFTPYETTMYGKHKIQLAIKGEQTQLQQEPEFEVVRGFKEKMGLAGLALVALAALAGLAVLAKWGMAYQKDRQTVTARIRSRKEKALHDLDQEPKERLLGEVRLTISGKTLGPMDLTKAPSAKEVMAWLDQHFSKDKSFFADEATNQKRMPLIERSLAAVRTDLIAEAEKRLPVRGADICVRDVRAGGGASHVEAKCVQDAADAEREGLKMVLSVRLLEDGKIRVSTASGKTMSLGRGESYPFNGWIGKNENQIRASVKIPGFADYSTVTIDLK